MPGWMIYLAFLWKLWSLRGVVVVSLVAHLILVFLADVRRRNATGVSTLLLQLADSVARWAPTFALGKLSVGSTPEEQQLATLWAALLLLHAALPDNIAAYSLEDSVLSWRDKIEVVQQMLFGPAAFILYKNIVSSASGADDAILLAPSILCFVAILKYVEKASFALSRANMDNMRDSAKKELIPRRLRSSLRSLHGRGGSRKQDNEQILLVAHGLRHITKGAFIDYNFLDNSAFDRQEVLSREWSDNEILYRVVDMELSLMYDMLYTKASMVYTWGGYAIRVVSPFASAAAFLLFWFHGKDGLRMADVIITYILLATTVLLDMGWLLRAVASTWTYSFLNDRPRCWLHHVFLCSGRWRLLRRLIVSLNLWRFLANKEPTGYRMWAGTIGQCNLFDECTLGTSSWFEMFKPLAEMMSLDGHLMEYRYQYLSGYDLSSDPDQVKKLLFEQIWEILKSAFPPPPKSKEEEEEEKKKKEEEEKKKKEEEEKMRPPIMALLPVPLAEPPRKPARYRRELEETLDFAPAFQETILIWHIATDVFLWKSRHLQTKSSCKLVQAIKRLSNYMVFLVAVRPSMLPGLKLRSLYEDTQKNLGDILTKERYSGSFIAEKKEKLVNSLIEWEKEDIKSSNVEKKNRPSWKPGQNRRRPRSDEATRLYNESVILSDGTKLAMMLLRFVAHANSQDISLTSYDRYMGLMKMIPKLKDRLLEVIYFLEYDLLSMTREWMQGSLDILDNQGMMDRLQNVIYDLKRTTTDEFFLMVLDHLPSMFPELKGILEVIKSEMENRENMGMKLYHLDDDLREQIIPKLKGLIDFSVILDHIFEEWVSLLMFASVRCTRDSHAKQLGCGGELTTVLWIITEHAGIFRIHGDKESDKKIIRF